MKLTNKQLRQIIKEELEAVMGEGLNKQYYFKDRCKWFFRWTSKCYKTN